VGTGTFGICKLIKRISDGKHLVWKELDYGQMCEREKQMLVSEVNILREFRHPNIVRYYDRIIDRDSTTIYIIMEHCPGGDLSTNIKQCRRERRYMDEKYLWKTFGQILSAMQECHRREGGAIMHRDLKPANIFLDKHGNAKLGDFGLARVLSNAASFARTFVGTPYYMSPEQLNEQRYNAKSDIWSLGCLLYELAALVPPFNASNQAQLRVKVNDGRFKKLPSYSEGLNNILKLMLQKTPANRPSIEELLRDKNVAMYLTQPEKTKSSRRRSSSVASDYPSKTGYSSKQVDIPKPVMERTAEDLLQAREDAVVRREKALHEREADLNRRERQLDERERSARLGAPESHYTRHAHAKPLMTVNY